ncbi:MAG: DUF3153 domain-containing protein [Okeania sp. SIO2G4]|uniref:DUF3153 domain-containing protein n=1 Tax=unclassified Okeania TaxID=2634635 RepID=UPI0013B67836|nr:MULTISPECIES: DUF3153 domain-containing protein [unclassified Okeania]NEP38060.1 DUF3153 domain-containing protein [Okeania sp. SIO2H7]NEP70919.1 DUF3153 domain-containing protein [Okeania sp. SIO2G5]NEP92301.1 DUF3153 domain-containing protein [Okeania sp. SIO2F5]NEQ89971.1 DUF3153 domain-containing protein [Okeania sp. SIO2G4]
MKVLKVILISFLAVLLLNGCVQYEVGINFESQNHGEIVQHIKLADELKNFSRKIVSEWLRSIDTRVNQLQGKTKKISSQEIFVTIPFNNGADLEDKFNQFFKPIDAQESNNYAADITADLPKFESQIEVSQNNLFLVLRNKLSINLDLQLSTSNSKVIVNPDELLDLEFQLTTPWGFNKIQANENDAITYLNERQIVWKLNPGESNSLDVVFWIPSPIGIGTILIGLFVYLGIALKYQVLPALGIIKK